LPHEWLETKLYQNTAVCACYYLTMETKLLFFDNRSSHLTKIPTAQLLSLIHHYQEQV
jgi:hypothetical protein